MQQLSDIQKWFYTCITHPAGVTPGAAESAASLNISNGTIVDIIKPSETLNAADRLAIYHNAYFLRLFGVLEAEYPALKFALGDELFRNFALFFLQQNPPTSFTLYELSAGFPEFLARTVPSENTEESWPDFIIDLVRLERLFQESYRSDGIEDTGSINDRTHDFSIVEFNEKKKLRISPSLKLMQSTFPVHHYLISARRGENVSLPDPKPTRIAVNRVNYNVKIGELTEDEFLALEQIADLHEIESSNSLLQHYRIKWVNDGFLY